MEKITKKGTLLDEAAQLKIYGGTSAPADSQLVVYLRKSCGKTWGDCKTICGPSKPFQESVSVESM